MVPHLCTSVEVGYIILKLAVVLQMSGVIQLTSAFYFSIFWILSKVKADAVGLLVTHQLTEIHVLDVDGFYCVIHQSFVRKEGGSWKLHGAKFSWKKMKNKSKCILKFPWKGLFEVAIGDLQIHWLRERYWARGYDFLNKDNNLTNFR